MARRWIAAAKRGDEAKVRALLADGADVDVKTTGGWTALHHASCNGHAKVVTLLLSSKADVNAKTNWETNWGSTALYWASRNGHAAVVALLIAANAGVDAKTNTGWTALHMASFNGDAAVVELLLDAKADVEVKGHDGSTALHHASCCGNAAVVAMLLAAGADVRAKNDKKATPGDLAARRRHPAVAALLRDAVADRADRSEGGEDEEGGAAAAATADEIEDEEETTEDDSVGRANGDGNGGEAPERAGERPPEVAVAPPVSLVGAADEVPSHVALPAANDNWDDETVPFEGERAASTDGALAATGTPAGAAVAGVEADARGPAAAEGEAAAAPARGGEPGAGPNQEEEAAPAQGEEATGAPREEEAGAAQHKDTESHANGRYQTVSAADSQGAVEDWLTRFLPGLQDEDLVRYRTRLIADGFDSSEGMTYVREEHLRFMKMGHRLRLTDKMRDVPAEGLGTSNKRKRAEE